MSDRVEQRILGLISTQELSPYGNPIPGLEELGGTSVPPPAATDGTPEPHLELLATAEEQQVTVTRIGEPAQVEPEVLSLLAEAGVLPGRSVLVRREDGRVLVAEVGADEAVGVSLPPDVAVHIFAHRA